MNKKLILILAMLMATTFAKAQSYSALENYSFGWYIQYMENLVELQDGNILTCTRLLNVDSAKDYSEDYGYCLLKLNREDASIMDSIFLPDDYTNFFLLEPHPTTDGYLFINQAYDFQTASNFLKIRHFYDNLTFDDVVTAPLIDTVYGGTDQFLLEENNFIMISGREDGSWICQRFGFDGTLKNRTVFPESVHHCEFRTGIKVWNESPKEYVAWGYTPGSQANFYYHILDSLLNIRETVALEHTPQYPNIWFGHDDNALESIDENTYLLATPFEAGNWTSPDYKVGVQVTKRDKATHTNLKTMYFSFEASGGAVVGASPYVVDVRQTEEGYIYLAFGDLTGINRFSVALLDSDLNVLWQQYYLNLEPFDFMYRMKVLNDGGLGLVGFNPSAAKVFALFINNDYDALDEQDIIIRPYTFYPNPAQSEVHLSYSPDVQPARIELYDLQGRLLHTQTQNLESIGLEGFAIGQYLMKVVLQDGKTFTDKVMKK